MNNSHPGALTLSLAFAAFSLAACSGYGAPVGNPQPDVVSLPDIVDAAVAPDVQPDVQRPRDVVEAAVDARSNCVCQGLADGIYWEVDCGGLVQRDGTVYACLDGGGETGHYLEQTPRGIIVMHACGVIGRSENITGIDIQCGGQPCCQDPGGPCHSHNDCCLATPEQDGSATATPLARCDMATHTCVQGSATP